ncbi:MAG: efflux RND transporter periplasmic adaptor subunit [Candidatus Solibacter sp.]
MSDAALHPPAGAQPLPPAARPLLTPRARARLRFWLGFLLTAAAVAGASYGAYRYRQSQTAQILPSAPARQGDFLVLIRCRGEIQAERSMQVYTPMVPNLRIAWLSPPGQSVKEGETIVKFDSSSATQQLQQKDAALRQAQATLDQAAAQSQITSEQDKTELADANFSVERARLEASKQDIVSRLQGEISKIDYGVSQQKLKVQEATVDLHAASDRSRLASLTRLRDQAKAEVELTKARIDQMELRSPITGFLIFQSNYSQGWMNAKPFKVGDNVYAGMVLAEMPDLATLRMDAKVEEIDRGRVSANQEVRVRVDSLPELTFNATIKQISLLAEANNEYPPVRNFRAYAAIPKPDHRLRPGMNGGMDIIVNRIPNAISIPAKALFTQAGKPIVYVAESGHYRAVSVEVLARNPDEVAISGIPAGAMVALVNPEKKEAGK